MPARAPEEAAGRARKDLFQERQRKNVEIDLESATIEKWLKYGPGTDEEWPWSGPIVSIPDEELTNPYSKRLAGYLRAIVGSSEEMRDLPDETEVAE
jgi:hypothetical protein